MEIPASLQIGDTWSWEDELDDYSADDGWTLTYHFQNEDDVFSVVASGDDTTHTSTVSAATSATKKSGLYKWFARVANDDSQPVIYTLDSGEVRLLADVTQKRDIRSWAKKAYDAFTEILEGRAAKESSALTYQGRSVQYMTWPEIIQAHAFLKAQVQVEEQANSNGLGRYVYVRHGRA